MFSSSQRGGCLVGRTRLGVESARPVLSRRDTVTGQDELKLGKRPRRIATQPETGRGVLRPRSCSLDKPVDAQRRKRQLAGDGFDESKSEVSMLAQISLLAIAMTLVLVGCATEGPQPTEELVRARTVIAQADKAGAQRDAPADLQRAHDELSNAEKSNTEKKFNEARRYAEAAAVDADVAAARAAAAEATRAAQEVAQGNETLRQESNRATSSPNPN
jgi:hypothetical protein